jgi:hypothetical protein
MVSMDEEYTDYSWLKAVPAKDPYALTKYISVDEARLKTLIDDIAGLKHRVYHLELLVDPAVQEEYNEVTRG